MNLGNIKEYIRNSESGFSKNAIFVGNSNIDMKKRAREVTDLLFNQGSIATNNLVVAGRSDLVAEYVGQTASKTAEVINSALGGVLFVEEAHELGEGDRYDFGKEALSTLIVMADAHREDLVVILAGNYDAMQELLLQNAAFQSRFPNLIQFEDYATMAQEIAIIIKNLYRMNNDYYDVLSTVESAVKKYGTTLDKLSLKIADVDHRKVILQILFDLRYARDTDYDFEIELYRCDTQALQDITYYLEKVTTEFNREGSTLIDISCLNREEYLEMIKKNELI